jgi:hypothetical protein
MGCRQETARVRSRALPAHDVKGPDNPSTCFVSRSLWSNQRKELPQPPALPVGGPQ